MNRQQKKQRKNVSISDSENAKTFFSQKEIKNMLLKRSNAIDKDITVAEKNPALILTKEDLKNMDRKTIIQIFLHLGKIDDIKYLELKNITQMMFSPVFSDEELKKELDKIEGGMVLQLNKDQLDIYYIQKVKEIYDMESGIKENNIPKKIQEIGVNTVKRYKPKNARRLLFPLNKLFNNIEGRVDIESPWGDKQTATKDSYLVLSVDKDNGDLKEFYVLNPEGTLQDVGYKPVDITEEDKRIINLLKTNLINLINEKSLKTKSKEKDDFKDIGD